MTTQTKKFIELADMLALHFSCKNCDATLTVSIDREFGKKEEFGLLNTCPVCKNPWASVNGSSCEASIKEFVDAFRKLSLTLGPQAGAFPAGFSLTLEVKAEKQNVVQA
jgi:hypothetical protein